MTTRKPEDLTRDELLDIVRGVYAALYIDDYDGEPDRDKEWSPDTLQDIGDVFDRHGLIPEPGERQ